MTEMKVLRPHHGNTTYFYDGNLWWEAGMGVTMHHPSHGTYVLIILIDDCQQSWTENMSVFSPKNPSS